MNEDLLLESHDKKRDSDEEEDWEYLKGEKGYHLGQKALSSSTESQPGH